MFREGPNLALDDSQQAGQGDCGCLLVEANHEARTRQRQIPIAENIALGFLNTNKELLDAYSAVLGILNHFQTVPDPDDPEENTDERLPTRPVPNTPHTLRK